MIRCVLPRLALIALMCKEIPVPLATVDTANPYEPAHEKQKKSIYQIGNQQWLM